MKKFLTMLLALSVVFTYTFGVAGSVFATTTDKDVYLAAVDSAKATALNALNAQYDLAKASLKANATEDSNEYKIGDQVVCADAWIAALDVLNEDIKTAVEAKVSALASASGSTYPDVTYKTITEDSDIVVVSDKKLDDVNTAEKMITVLKAVEDYKFVASKAQYATDKSKYIAAANGVDTAIYSTTDSTPAPYVLTVTKSYTNAKAYADALVADLVSMLNTNTYVNLAVTDSSSTLVAGKAVAMKALFDDVIGQDANTKKYFIKETNNYAVYNGANYNSEYATAKGDNARYDIVSLTEEKVSDQNKTYTIQANINTQYNYIYQGKKYNGTSAETETSISAADADAIAAWQPLADAYKFVAENSASVPNFPAWAVTYSKTKGYVLAETSTYYVENVKAYNDTKALVENLKATGKYDAEALDDALEAFMATVCNTASKAIALSTSSDAIKACLIASVTDFDKEAEKYDFSLKLTEEADANGLYTLSIRPVYNSNSFAAGTVTYYAKEWEAVKAAADAYCKAVDAAVNPSDISDAKKVFNNAVYAVKASGSLKFDTAFTNAVAYANGDVQAYISLLNANAATADDRIDASAYNDLDKVTKWFKVNGARTAADVTSMTAALKAEIAALPTAGELKTIKTTVNNQIAALPGTLVLTFADKDKVVAAFKAVVEATEDGVTGLSETTLKNVIKKMHDLEKQEVAKAYKTIKNSTATTVTVADKEAVLAAKAVYDAYVEGFAAEDTDGFDGMYTYESTVTKDPTYAVLGDKCTDNTLYNKIRGLELEALIDDINAANEKTPLADVKALKEKCEAFVKEYNCIKDDYDAAVKITNANKVDTLLAALEEAAKWTDKDVKAALYDMSRKATIWRTSKTSIRVTATGSVADIKDNGYTVKYTFYKKAPGATAYKAVKTTTSNKYTYTNLKKGTNKFQVKVKVYDADGKLVASKWTYYRAAKVK